MNSKKKSSETKSISSEKRLRWIVALAAIILYVQTLPYKYTLDDEVFILNNTTVQKGASGILDLFVNGSLSDFGIQPYRPITLSSFSIEKSLFGDNSTVRHLVNIFAYLFLLQLLFTLLRRLFKHLHPIYITAIVLLFAAHPLHTEAVASVKGRDELFAALFALLAWIRLLPKSDGESVSVNDRIMSTLFFGMSCFSKESGIVFLVLIPLADLLFVSKSLRKSILLSIPLAGMAALYLFARQRVNGGIVVDTDIPVMANILNATGSFGDLWATRATLLFYYVKLLFIPWPLTWDYSFNQIPVQTWTDLLPWLSAGIYSTLIILAVLQRKKNPVITYCILFFLVASLPTNNLLFRTGSTMGERFLFVPSIAFCIALVTIGLRWSNVPDNLFPGIKSTKAFLPFIVLLGTFCLGTWARNPDWRNNLTLFESGVKGSPNSTRTHYSLASEYMRQAQKEGDYRKRSDLLSKARSHYEKSIDIYPENYQALYNAGICYSLAGDTTRAIDCYSKTIGLNSKYLTAMNNMGVLYQSRMEFDSAAKYYLMAYRIDSSQKVAKENLSNLFYNKGIYLSMQNRPDSAIGAYRSSTTYDPSNIMALNNMASLFTVQARYDSALFYLKMANAVKPGDLFLIENIAAVSLLNREFEQAERFARQGLQLNPQSPKSLGVLRDIGEVRQANR
ncbi:MAG: tetratricopeptide repeat protein [Bacteroidota bacterium]